MYLSVPSGVSVDASVLLHIAADPDVIGWYSVTDPSVIHWINSASMELSLTPYTFSPGGEFGLVAENEATGQFFYSNTGDGGTIDTGEHVSHFAFFGSPSTIPEPGTVMLMGTALLGISFMLRRRKKENAD